jgi:hypothetical protein
VKVPGQDPHAKTGTIVIHRAAHYSTSSSLLLQNIVLGKYRSVLQFVCGIGQDQALTFTWIYIPFGGSILTAELESRLNPFHSTFV